MLLSHAARSARASQEPSRFLLSLNLQKGVPKREHRPGQPLRVLSAVRFHVAIPAVCRVFRVVFGLSFVGVVRLRRLLYLKKKESVLAASPCKKIRPELSAVVYFCGGLPSPHTPGSESRCASAPRKKGGSLSGAPPTLPIREAGGFPGGASCKVLHALRAAKKANAKQLRRSCAVHTNATQYRCI